MSIATLVIGLVLAGQVSSANERYPVSGNRPPGTSSPPDNAASSGLIPKFAPPSANDRARDAGAEKNAADDPFPRQPASSPTGGQQVAPPSGSSATTDTDARGSQSPLGNQSAQTPSAGPVKPSVMMRVMLTAPRDSQLSGERISLVDVVAGATSRPEQTQRVEAYWDMCSSVADYYLGLREKEDLRQLRTMMPSAGPTWQQAESELAVRMGTSKQGAVASQLRLAGWLGRGAGSLPLPGDFPHCGSYHSRYEEIFAGRPSAEAESLASLLPQRYAELKDAAGAVTRAEEWLRVVARNEKGDGMGTLRALEFLALRRRAFVQIARDYNRRIARYAELATPGQIGAEQLVGMLIKRDNLPTATRPSLPAGTSERQSRSTAEGRTLTFADGEGWEPADQSRTGAALRDEAVEPASSETRQLPREERSLLVRPQSG